MNEKEARRILDVAPNATLAECKKSMIKQQKAFHPNFAKNDDQREVFTRKSQEVNDAYSFIKTRLEKKSKTKNRSSKQESTNTAQEWPETVAKVTEDGIKALRREAMKRYNEKNKEKLKALRKEYQEKSKEKMKKIQKELREKNKKRLKEYKKELKKKSKQTFP
ncbi:MAG: hypothetical protein CL735_02775 [Chloroflexi bacterium]|nr:hypothetical protein [Chloroflexota bacterium]|tara:strand:- start:21991 stop:22482 length:492 start_codon:yes stop_codon:yes gene_type:complete